MDVVTVLTVKYSILLTSRSLKCILQDIVSLETFDDSTDVIQFIKTHKKILEHLIKV